METPDLYSSTAQPSASGSNALAELQEEVNSLRALFNLILIFLLLMSFSANYLLLKQVGKVRAQVEATQPQVEKAASDYENVLKPRVSVFLQSLVRFAQTDPEFLPVLQKYPIQFQKSAAATAPASSPVPAPPTK